MPSANDSNETPTNWGSGFSSDLSRVVHDLDMLQDQLGGAGGVRERLTKIETTVAAHDEADQERHRELLATVNTSAETVEKRVASVEAAFRESQRNLFRLLLAQMAIVLLVVTILGALVGVRSILGYGDAKLDVGGDGTAASSATTGDGASAVMDESGAAATPAP